MNILATGYTLAPDKSYYEFTLRKGVKFSDGTDFNAQAVKWNFDRVIEAGLAPMVNVKSVEVIDDYTIRLNLKKWNNQILANLTAIQCNIISPTAFEKNGGTQWAQQNGVGTGPFIYQGTINNQYMKFTRNPNYWDKDVDGNPLPYLDEIDYITTPDLTTFTAGFIAGQLDAMGTATVQVGEQLKSRKDAVVTPINKYSHYSLGFNSIDPNSVWSDQRMRRALELAIDKKTISDTIFRGFNQPIYNVIRGVEEITKEDIIPDVYNPEKAKQLMSEAGYPNGFTCDLWLHSGMWAGSKDVVLAIQSDLQAVGINVRIKPVEGGEYIEKITKPLAPNDLTFRFMSGSMENPGEMIAAYLIDGKSASLPGHSFPQGWNDLVEQYGQIESWDDQMTFLAKMDKIAYDYKLLVPLWDGSNILVKKSNINNYDLHLAHRTQTYYYARTWKSQ
ncbi:MAG: ABC transporter substrate-binding protein [Dehalococcoidales bacterium]|nr:ABC transporter substrate-binding protein [Dehalococcoidales bacterium]